jgi:hypothetical protein
VLTTSVLIHCSIRLPLILACDAYSYGFLCNISHIIHDVIELPISCTSYSSITLKLAEKNYANFDKEPLAVVYGVQKFYMYVAGRKFTIISNNKPIFGMFRPGRQIPDVVSPRVLIKVVIIYTKF